jgi:hypothetical protein
MRLRLSGGEHEAIATDATFAVAPGQLAFAPGSSGWSSPRGAETRWMELFLRGGSAWEAMGRPPVGARFRLTVA